MILNEKWQMQLTDFGTARKMISGDQSSHSVSGTSDVSYISGLSNVSYLSNNKSGTTSDNGQGK